MRTKFSIVVPTFNVGPYFDEFLASLTSQSTGLESAEIIIVDDGSTDNTAEIAKAWQSRYPAHIQYLYQANQGAAAARNTGLAVSKGDWVSFPDPDDFLDSEYFAQVNRAIAREREGEVALIVCNMIFYIERTAVYSDTHPLRFKFSESYRELPLSDVREEVQLSAASCWFDGRLLRRSGLQFDVRVKPTFEDGHLVNRYLLEASGKSVVFLKDAKYFYRKRANESSQVDTKTSHKSYYLDHLEFGYLDLLRAAARLGPIPPFIQNVVIYDLSYKIRHILGDPSSIQMLTPDEKRRSVELFEQIFDLIDDLAIMSSRFLTWELRVGVMGLFKRRPVSSDRAYLFGHDASQRTVEFRIWNSSADDLSQVIKNGVPTDKRHPKTARWRFYDDTFAYLHRFHVRAKPVDALQIFENDLPLMIRAGVRDLGTELRVRRAKKILLPKAIDPATLSQADRDLRLRALSPEINAKYKNAWVLMDREDAADDNAEHLYRYLRDHTDENIFFALRQSSQAWERLACDGFNLVDFGSEDYKLAVLNAEYIVSSHGDYHIRQPLARSVFGDLLRYQFIFLQHGVTKDDFSQWFNAINPRLLMCATYGEYKNFVLNGNGYRLSDREVKLTGFPRHDALTGAVAEAGDHIFIMPTWREWLVGRKRPDSGEREVNAEFGASSFVVSWTGLLQSKSLRRLAERHGKRIVFCPHPNLVPYLPALKIPRYIEVISPFEIASIQTYLQSAAVLITDYSSIAFDFAYMKKPVIYYQFDYDEFRKRHLYRAGYFSYLRDGFGPVAEDVGSVIKALRKALAQRERIKFSMRRRRAFPKRDGNASRRVYREIAKLRPRPETKQTNPAPSADGQ